MRETSPSTVTGAVTWHLIRTITAVRNPIALLVVVDTLAIVTFKVPWVARWGWRQKLLQHIEVDIGCWSHEICHSKALRLKSIFETIIEKILNSLWASISVAEHNKYKIYFWMVLLKSISIWMTHHNVNPPLGSTHCGCWECSQHHQTRQTHPSSRCLRHTQTVSWCTDQTPHI